VKTVEQKLDAIVQLEAELSASQRNLHNSQVQNANLVVAFHQLLDSREVEDFERFEQIKTMSSNLCNATVKQLLMQCHCVVLGQRCATCIVMDGLHKDGFAGAIVAFRKL
jgi:hypothetical protein